MYLSLFTGAFVLYVLALQKVMLLRRTFCTGLLTICRHHPVVSPTSAHHQLPHSSSLLTYRGFTHFSQYSNRNERQSRIIHKAHSSLFTRKGYFQYSHYSTQSSDWDVQYTQITLQNKSVPVNFNVGYVDSAHGNENKHSLPVILGLHGCPGTHRDIEEFLKPYADKGYRVVLPNMPSFGITTFADQDSPGFKRESLFTHSPQEQADFIAQFLRDLSISSIELFVGHSVGIIAPVVLCASATIQVKGAVFICAFYGHMPPQGMQPYGLVKMAGKWWYEGGLKRRIVVGTYRQVIAKRNQVKYSNDEEVGAIMQTGYNMDFETFPTFAKQMCDQKIPLLYVITDLDPLMRAVNSLEFAEMLGVKNDDFASYDSVGTLLKDLQVPNKDVFSRGIRFASSSHTPHLEEEMVEVMHKEMDKMLKH